MVYMSARYTVKRKLHAYHTLTQTSELYKPILAININAI